MERMIAYHVPSENYPRTCTELKKEGFTFQLDAPISSSKDPNNYPLAFFSLTEQIRVYLPSKTMSRKSRTERSKLIRVLDQL